MNSEDIRMIRLTSGKSQEEMANFLGVSRPTYSAIEHGHRDMSVTQASKLMSLRDKATRILGRFDMSNEIGVSRGNARKYKQMITNAIKYGADSDGRITKTKLAKLIYLADFAWYYDHLVPMSGVAYRKLPQGPVPDIYFRTIDELFSSGVIDINIRGNAMLISLVEPDSVEDDSLSKLEKLELKRIAKIWQSKNTNEIVEFTHSQIPWQVSCDGEVIPYELITQEDSAHVRGPEVNI